MTYAFKRQRDARNAAAISRQRPPSTIGEPDNPGRGSNWLAFTIDSGIPARDKETGEPGKADCEISSLYDDDIVEVPSGSGRLTIPVYNITYKKIPAGLLLPVWQVGGKFVTDGASGKTSLARFKTTAKMTSREVQAELTWVADPPENPDTENPYEPGDTVTLSDPRNVFPDVEANATGMAYWADFPDGSGGTDSRWEILNCTLPINEVRAKLEACMFKNTLNGQVTVDTSDGRWNMADGLNVDLPPEFGSPSGTEYSITFENDLGFDAVIDEYIYLRRVTNADASEPDNTEVPKAGSSTLAKWQVVDVDDCIARWLCVEKLSESSWMYLSHWEGKNQYAPDKCGTTVDVIDPCFSSQCAPNGTKFTASYNPEENKYVLISSQSALLGAPQTAAIPSGNPVPYCDENGNYCFTWDTQKVSVFASCEETPTPSEPITQCINGYDFYQCTDLCTYICTYCDVFATDEICEPCEGVCEWTWDDTAKEWNISNTDDCTPENPDCGCYDAPDFDGTFEGEVAEVPCSAEVPPPPCENCTQCPDEQLTLSSAGFTKSGIFDPGGTLDIGWSIVGNIQPNGDCAFTADIEWTASQIPGPPDPPGPVASSVDITYDGGSKQWTATPAIGSPWTTDTGQFSVDTSVDTCAVGYNSEPGDNAGVFPVDPNPEQITVTLEIGATPCAALVSISSIFRRDNADLLGCGCSRGVLAVMDRWSEVDDSKIDRAAQTLHNKNLKVSKSEIAQRIRAAVEEWQSSLNRE
jgi:hypothetical protein